MPAVHMGDVQGERRKRSAVQTVGSEAPHKDPPASPFTMMAYNLDSATVLSLQMALPNWRIQVVPKATLASIGQVGNIPSANLLVLGDRRNAKATLGLCRGLRSIAGRTGPPLLVLLSTKQSDMVERVLEAGANKCLILPFRPAEVEAMVTHGSPPPDRLPAEVERIERENRWQDDGGQG